MDPLFIAATVAIITALLGYLGIAKKLSGKIKDTAAEALWEESRAIRKDLMERNEFLRGVIDKCETRIKNAEVRIDELEERNHSLHMENGSLQKQIQKLDKIVADLRLQVSSLEAENKALKDTNFLLKRRVTELEGHHERGT